MNMMNPDISLSNEIPEDETARQYYYIEKTKKYVDAVSKELGRPLTFCVTTFGCQMAIVYMPEHLSFEVMGETRDDAAGEVLDKVARSLGLPYPGGAALEKLASDGDPHAIDFPRAWLEPDSYDFSFSGLKSHVLNYLNRAEMKGESINKADVAASFQEALFEVLAEKAVRACKEKGVNKLVLSGGVAANGCLKRMILERTDREGITFHYPPKVLCTDNAAMIGGVAYYKYLKNDFNSISLNATANMPLQNE